MEGKILLKVEIISLLFLSLFLQKYARCTRRMVNIKYIFFWNNPLTGKNPYSQSCFWYFEILGMKIPWYFLVFLAAQMNLQQILFSYGPSVA